MATKLKTWVNRKLAGDSPHHASMPDMVMLLKYEMSGCSRKELIDMAQKLIDSKMLPFFDHPMRRTCYDLALSGLVGNVIVPSGYSELTLDTERVTRLNTTLH